MEHTIQKTDRAGVKLGRPAVKSRKVTARLRREITSGAWTPGTRVPPRRELCEMQECSPSTLQLAMNTLAAEGFIVSMGQHGTVISAAPPHLTDIAVVFPEPPSRNRFWSALNSEIQRPRDDGFTLSGWYGIGGHVDDPGYAELLDTIKAERLAGIIFASKPSVAPESPLLMHPVIPQVSFVVPLPDYPHLGTISFDYDSFIQRAAAYMRDEGRTRVAVVTGPNVDFAQWQAAFAQAGLSLPPHRFQPTDLRDPTCAQHLARLLFHEDQEARPDAIVIEDDNLVEPVTLGMAEAGVRALGEVEILAHTNFPWPPPSSLPVTRLGWDARVMLNTAMDMLSNMRQGKPTPRTKVDAVFENELASARVSERMIVRT